MGFQQRRLQTPIPPPPFVVAASLAAWVYRVNVCLVGHMKKNVAGQFVGAQMVTAVDGTVFTGSVTVSVTGDAGAQATGSVGAGACAHEGNGYHTYAPAQAETNYGLIAFTFTGTGAVAQTVQVYTSFPQTGDSFTRTYAKTSDITGFNDISTGQVDTALTNYGALKPTVASRTLDVTATGEAGIDWANIGAPTTTVGLSGTTVGTLTTYTGDTPQTGDSFARLGAPAGASIAADLVVIDNFVDGLEATIGAAGAGLTAIADQVWDEDATAHQTGGTFGQAIGDPVADTNTIFKAVVTDAAGATVGVDVVAVKAETVAILVDTGTTLDSALAVVDSNVDAILVDTGTTLQGEVDAIQADVAAILVDTGTTLDGRIPAALVGGRMDASVGAMAANVITATAINADAITAAKVADGTIDAATFAAGAINAAAIAADAITAAKIAPDAIGASELAADAVTEIQSGLATAASLTTRANAIDAALVTIDDFIDTEVGAVVGFVDDLEARLTVGLTDKLAAHSAAVLILVVGAGSTTTAVKLGTVDGAAPSAVNDFYNGRVIVFTSGALAGQAVQITDYDGATTTATVTAATAAPADTVTGVIV